MFCEKIIHLAKIGSTQNYAKKIAEKSISGTIVVSDKQTKGRGQFERKFNSPSGGLYFSLILKPETAPQELPGITRKMAVAAVETITRTVKNKEYTVFIKPPNDIMVGRVTKNDGQQYRKIAGILTESSLHGRKIDYVVVGVGVNINNRIPKKLRTTAISLKEITGITYGVSAIFNCMIKNFKKAYLTSAGGTAGAVPAGYKRLCKSI